MVRYHQHGPDADAWKDERVNRPEPDYVAPRTAIVTNSPRFVLAAEPPSRQDRGRPVGDF